MAGLATTKSDSGKRPRTLVLDALQIPCHSKTVPKQKACHSKIVPNFSPRTLVGWPALILILTLILKIDANVRLMLVSKTKQNKKERLGPKS